MKSVLIAALIAVIPIAGWAQTFPSPTYNSLTLQTPLSQTSGGAGAASLGAGSVTPTGGTAASLANLLSGVSPTPSFRVNPFPTTTAPAYSSTSGNNCDFTLGNSSTNTNTLWQNQIGGAAHDGVCAVLSIVPGTKNVQNNAVTGYIYNLNGTNVQDNKGVGVGVNYLVINGVDGTDTWGHAGVAGDDPTSAMGVTVTASTSGTTMTTAVANSVIIGQEMFVAGSSIGVITSGSGTSWTLSASSTLGSQAMIASWGRKLQNEYDWHPAFRNTHVNGNIQTMDSPVQPDIADANSCGSTYNGTTKLAKWQTCIHTYPGQVILGAVFERSHAPGVASDPSQPIQFVTNNSSAAAHAIQLYGADTDLVLNRTDSGVANLNLANGNVAVQTGHSVTVAGLPLIGSDSASHIALLGSAPLPSGCGTSPSMTTGSRDNAGTIVVGSGGTTTCVLGFSQSFAGGIRPIPSCVATLYNSGQAVFITARSSTSITFATGSSMAGGVEINYHCM